MTIISIDIETTGLDFETCQILEFGAVLVQDGFPSFRALIKPDGPIVGEPRALAMHARLLDELANGGGLAFHQAMANLTQFLHEYDVESFTIAGKNFSSFDARFLGEERSWRKLTQQFKVPHRVIDVGSVYWCPDLDGDTPPNTETLLARFPRFASPPKFAHTALGDAQTVASLLFGYIET